MADLTFKQASQVVQIVGGDEVNAADVLDVAGTKRLASDSLVSIQAVVSSANSSSSPLGISGVFTGVFEEILQYSNVSVSAHADQDSVSSGLLVEWSTDGTNVDDTDSFLIKANAPKHFTFGANYKYVRVKYTNGTTGQGFFRLQTIYHPFVNKPSSHRVDSIIVPEDDAELVKSVLTGKEEGTDEFKNIGVINERLKVQAVFAPGAQIVPTLGTNLAYDDMNVANGGVARDTVFTGGGAFQQVYSYTGSGLLISFILTLEVLSGDPTKNWDVRLVVDDVEIFGSSGINTYDLNAINRYGFESDATKTTPDWGGLQASQNSFRWQGPLSLPVSFSSDVKIYTKHNGDNRKFLAGLVAIVKET